MPVKRALILGVGFIGSALARDLRASGYEVTGVDLDPSNQSAVDSFILSDIRGMQGHQALDFIYAFDEVYQLAADFGGAGYCFTGAHDADILRNNLQINTNVLTLLAGVNFRGRVFFASSACVYPEHNQSSPQTPNCVEGSVYPAAPDSDYGWEKLTAERLYLAHARNYGLTIRIGRLHAIYGPGDDFDGGREKAPMALCRKAALSDHFVEVWGDGQQTRSFLYIDDCIRGIRALMASNEGRPTNIGSEEMVSINGLAELIIRISGRDLLIKNIPGPQGVRGRRSDNTQMFDATGWEPSIPLFYGLQKTYSWIEEQLRRAA